MNNSPKAVLVIGFIILLLTLFNKITTQNAAIMFGFAFLAIYGFDSYWNKMRYQTPQFISATVHGSIDDYDLVGGWAVIPLGSCKAAGLYDRGGQATIVTKADYNYWVGPNLLSLTAPEKKDLVDLPPEVHDHCIDNPDFKPPFWLATKPLNPDIVKKETLAKQSLDVSTLLEENTGLWRLVNELKKVLRERESYFDRQMGRIVGTSRSIRGKSVSDRIKRTILGGDEKPEGS